MRWRSMPMDDDGPPPPLQSTPHPGRGTADGPTICACASATGGHSAIVRLSGAQARAIAARAALPLGAAWTSIATAWPLAGGTCPCRVLFAPAPRSFTGCDLVEVTLPGARDLIDLALAALCDAGAEAATPGAFTRQALAHGRLSLDQAEAILALAQAPSANAAAQALARLRGALATDLAAARERLLHARALVEAGLDFLDEADVRAYDPLALRGECAALRGVVERWRVAADSIETHPRVCLVGAANAGKSALFNRLAGDTQARALVSPVAGTTRDWLEAEWLIAGRSVRLIDTAGWLAPDATRAGGVDRAALAAGQATLDGAALIIACSAPDAPLPADLPLPAERTVVIATKADLGVHEARAVLAVSVLGGTGLDQLAGLVASRLASVAGGEPRQQRLLGESSAILTDLAQRLPPDELLAEDLRRCADLLGELLGATTPDEVLDAIFARFCIGK